MTEEQKQKAGALGINVDDLLGKAGALASHAQLNNLESKSIGDSAEDSDEEAVEEEVAIENEGEPVEESSTVEKSEVDDVNTVAAVSEDDSNAVENDESDNDENDEDSVDDAFIDAALIKEFASNLVEPLIARIDELESKIAELNKVNERVSNLETKSQPNRILEALVSHTKSMPEGVQESIQDVISDESVTETEESEDDTVVKSVDVFGTDKAKGVMAYL